MKTLAAPTDLAPPAASLAPGDAASNGSMHKDAAHDETAQTALEDAGVSPEAAREALSAERRAEAVSTLPAGAWELLVRQTPAPALWKWLNDAEQPDQIILLHTATKGFRRTPAALRQSAVRSRLSNHFAAHADAALSVLDVWAESQSDLLSALTADENAVSAPLLPLVRVHGSDAVLLALLAVGQLSDETRAAWQEAVERAAVETSNGEIAATKQTSHAAPEPASVVKDTALRAAEAAWQQRAEDAEKALSAAKTTRGALERALGEARAEAGRAAQKAAQELGQAQGRAASDQAALQQQLAETRRHAERDARRLKVAEREREELSGENKRLKRQLRQGQTRSEELRREAAGLHSKLEAAQAELAQAELAQARDARRGAKSWQAPLLARVPGNPAARAPQPTPSPLDIPLSWNADGRPFRVTPREIKRAIDTNDETFVNRLIQALDPLRVDDDAKFDTLLKRLRDVDRFYARVLTHSMTRVLIDASNVARMEKNARGKGQLRHLIAMRDELRRRDCYPILIYADASLPFNIDEPDEFIAMARRGEVQTTLPGQEADELLAREARRTGAYVVTNDRNFHMKVSPDYEPPRITFRIHSGLLIVDEF